MSPETLVAWYCERCGRQELPAGDNWCPKCGDKMQRCSRYEWFLSDALEAELEKRGVEFWVEEQYPFTDHRGFLWYFDLRVWCESKTAHGSYGWLIEIDGPGHSQQKKYKGPGGGYTRDEDKVYEYNAECPRATWCALIRVTNEDCARKGGAVYRTAERLVSELWRWPVAS